MERSFFTSTTLHGANDLYIAYKEHNKVSLVFWSVVVCCMTAFVGYGCYCILQGYKNAPTATVVSVETVDKLRLPDIALCFMGGPNVTKMREAGMSKNLIANLIAGDSTGMSASFIPMQFTDTETNLARSELKYFLGKNHLSVHDIRTKFAFTCNDLLLSAVNICAGSFVIPHRDYGSCFIIKGRVQNFPGTSSGVKICGQLPPSKDVFQHKGYTRLYGFGMEFGAPYVGVNLASYFIPQGQGAKVTFQTQLTKRSEKCISDKLYTRANCKFQCHNEAMLKECGCNDIYLSHNIKPNTTYCDVFASGKPIKENKCLERTDKAAEACLKTCFPECSQWQFNPTISYSTINDVEFHNALAQYKDLPESDGSHVHLEIGYPLLEYLKYEEKQTFTPSMAVSNLGGQAGLWLGCSFITIIHALVFGVSHLFKRCLRLLKKKDEDEKSVVSADPGIQKWKEAYGNKVQLE